MTRAGHVGVGCSMVLRFEVNHSSLSSVLSVAWGLDEFSA